MTITRSAFIKPDDLSKLAEAGGISADALVAARFLDTFDRFIITLPRLCVDRKAYVNDSRALAAAFSAAILVLEQQGAWSADASRPIVMLNFLLGTNRFKQLRDSAAELSAAIEYLQRFNEEARYSVIGRPTEDAFLLVMRLFSQTYFAAGGSRALPSNDIVELCAQSAGYLLFISTSLRYLSNALDRQYALSEPTSHEGRAKMLAKHWAGKSPSRLTRNLRHIRDLLDDGFDFYIPAFSAENAAQNDDS